MTDRQLEFARLVAGGMAQSEAYRQVYGAGRCAHAAAANSSRLMRNDKVLRKIDELRGRADESAVLSRQQRLEMLSALASSAAQRDDVSAVCKAIDILNRMDGAYAPEEKKLSGSLGVMEILDGLGERA